MSKKQWGHGRWFGKREGLRKGRVQGSLGTLLLLGVIKVVKDIFDNK